MSKRVVIIESGVGGLTARARLPGGPAIRHPSSKRDPRRRPHADAEEAFAAGSSAPHRSHQTHRASWPASRCMLGERFPDDAGRPAGRPAESTLPMAQHLGPAQPGDEDLQVIIVRRTTLEWVLRPGPLATPGTCAPTPRWPGSWPETPAAERHARSSPGCASRTAPVHRRRHKSSSPPGAPSDSPGLARRARRRRAGDRARKRADVPHPLVP